MKQIALILLLLNSCIVYSQSCDCIKEFKFVIDKVESDLPAYFDQVNDANRNSYNKHRSLCISLSEKAKSDRECMGVIATYLSFFRDNHLRYNYKDKMNPYQNLSDTVSIAQYFKNDKKLSIKNIDSLSKLNNNSIEGVWHSIEGDFVIAVCANKSLFGDYSGIIIKADKKYWEEGQIKFEFQQQSEDKYSSLIWTGLRTPRAFQTTVVNDTLNIGRGSYTFIRDKKPTETYQAILKKKVIAEFHNNKLILKQLSDQTIYLAIPSFDGENKASIDSIIGNNLSLLKTKHNLIIDIRNNGGGNSPVLNTLLPFIYTNPIIKGCTQYLGSADYIKFYEFRRDSVDMAQKDKDEDSKLVELMKMNIGGFTPCEPYTYRSETSFNNLKNIAVLSNKYTASTAELFLIFCKQSSKTKIYGSNSTGMIGYGNVRYIDLPTLPFYVSMAMSKNSFYSDYEYVGVPPNVYLNNKEEMNWIDQVQKIIEKK